MASEAIIDRPSRRWSISEPALLVAVPAIAYAMAFANEAGIATYYGLPMGVITVGVSQMVIPLLCVTFVFIYYLVAREAIDARSPTWWRGLPFAARSVILTFPLLLVTAAGIMLPVNTFVVLTAGTILLRLFYSRPGKADRFRRMRARLAEIRRWDLLEMMVVLLVTVCIVFVGGLLMGRHHQKFFVVSGVPERVVLRVYGTTAICARFDRQHKLIRREFSFLDLQTSPDIELKKERLGRLNCAD